MELRDAWNQDGQSDPRGDQPTIVRGASDGHARRVHTASVVARMGMVQFRTAMAWQRKDEPDSVAPWFLRDSSGFQIVSELSPLSTTQYLIRSPCRHLKEHR
jgi:hypothetical protein